MRPLNPAAASSKNVGQEGCLGEELSVGPVVGMVAQWAEGDAAPEGDAGPEMDLDGNKHHKLDVTPLSDPERLS